LDIKKPFMKLYTIICILALVGGPSPAAGPEPMDHPKMSSRLVKTPSGIGFRLAGDRGQRPAPTLFMFGSSAQTSVEMESFNTLGFILARDGFLSVGIDAPGHGEDVRPGEPAGLSAWRSRLEAGEDFLATFEGRFTAVLDYLVKEGYSDAHRIAVCGSSRGGFLALHAAANDPRVRAIVVFAPVTDLLQVREFKGMKDPSAASRLDVMDLAGKLAGRALCLSISYNDERVGTRHAIDFALHLMELSPAQKRPMTGLWSDDDIKLTVTPAQGAEGHSTFQTAHEEAAAWLLRRFGKR
jgi:pimeloyl-ACP methyl ester carboxylesterase